MGQPAPLIQLAVKVFKFSRFHTCVVCQLARITKCLNTMEEKEKKMGGSRKEVEVRGGKQKLFARERERKEKGERLTMRTCYMVVPDEKRKICSCNVNRLLLVLQSFSG